MVRSLSLLIYIESLFLLWPLLIFRHSKFIEARLFWQRHNVRFLLPLGLGMFAAVLFLANLIQYSLIHFRPAVWSLFLAVMIVALTKSLKRCKSHVISRSFSVVLFWEWEVSG